MDNTVIRLVCFFSIFCIMAIAEYCFPARLAKIQRKTRWFSNVLLVFLGALAAKVILPAGLLGIAFWVEQQQLGLFNFLHIDSTVAVIVAIVLLDLCIYWQHRLFHTLPLLWCIHKVHHADSHVDTTTGLRFHPLEIVLSLLVKALVIVLLGVPVIAVFMFEILLNAFAIFNHANIRLPQWLDNKLAFFIVTQRLHRIHHSQFVTETNSNYGFSITWWDKLFGSFCRQAKQCDEQLTIGLKAYPATLPNARLRTLVIMPFKKQTKPTE